MIYATLHRKLKGEQHEVYKTCGLLMNKASTIKNVINRDGPVQRRHRPLFINSNLLST